MREDGLIADGLPFFEAGADFHVVRVEFSKYHRFLHGSAACGFNLHFRSGDGIRNVIDGNENSVFHILRGRNDGNVGGFSFGQYLRHGRFVPFEPERTRSFVNEVLGRRVLVRKLRNDFRYVGLSVYHRGYVGRNRNVHGRIYLELQARFVREDLAKHGA